MNVTRISGLASGMDTESIVKGLMDAQRVPLQKMQRQQVSISWKQDSYREANTALSRFRNVVSDLRLQGPFLTKKAISSDANVVSAKTTSESIKKSYEVMVSQLAEKAELSSNQLGDGTTKLRLTDKINTSGKDFEIDLNGKKIEVTKDMTVQQFEDAVNAVSGDTKVRAYYSELKGEFKFTSTVTGETNSKINIKALSNTDGTTDVDGQNFITNDLKMTTTSAVGKSAIININGRDMKSENNTLTYEGTEFTFKALTNKPIIIDIKPDVDGVVDRIRKFVSAYNDVIDELNGKVKEKKNNDYHPLLESEKGEMSENQVVQWENKAKSGILRGDSILQSALTGMRNDLSNPVGGFDMNVLSEIGISTAKGMGAYKENGKLYIDEDKLRQAIEQNPEAVMNMFTKDGANGTEGIAKRLLKTIDKAMGQISKKAGNEDNPLLKNFLGEEKKELDGKINRFNERLSQVENRYWNQFTAMEKMISQANSQSAWLMQQFGGM
jgi:flagellar hook-associated protein 2